MTVLIVTGTGTGVGKTVVTAAVAALAPSCTVVKPAQTGVADDQPGDLSDVERLAGDGVPTLELARYPDPLSPEAAARRSGRTALTAAAVADAVRGLDGRVLVEGAGGLLVRFGPDGTTLADVAVALGAPVLVVTTAGLGTLNATALTLEALAARSVPVQGVVLGAWPAEPDLASRCNVEDLRALAPLLGALPAGAGDLSRAAFRSVAEAGLAPALGGVFDAGLFAARVAP